MTTKQVVAVLLVLVAVLTGCGDSKEIADQRAKLKLAGIKGDLDAIYLSLNRLAEAGDKEAVSRLPDITNAIGVREKMELALSDHDHEEALVFASQLLEQVPNNKKAKKVIRESGQIFYYLLSAKMLLAQIQSEEEGEVYVKAEKVSLDLAGQEEEQQKNLTKLVQKQLLQLDYDIGNPDGVAGKKTNSAIKKHQKKQDLEVTGLITVSLANSLYEAIAAKEEKKLRDEKRKEYSERLYEGIKNARGYAIKAKELDPHFKGSLDFEKSIEQTQSSFIYIHGANVIEAGQTVVSLAAGIYGQVSDLLSMAVSSEYLSVQTVWSSVEGIVDEAKKDGIDPTLDEMDRVGRLLATYEDGSAKMFADATQDYIRIVRKTVDALLVPQGSYRDYSRAANDAATQYKDARFELERSIPTTISIEESFSGLVKVLSEYSIYENDEVSQIVQNNTDLYKI